MKTFLSDRMEEIRDQQDIPYIDPNPEFDLLTIVCVVTLCVVTIILSY